jgi:2,3-dihydroxyphenylpropionate 1,2-dioxygenase
VAEIVGLVAMSHSPSWDMGAPIEGAGAKFAHAVAETRDLVARYQPDALVVFGPDHFRNFFYDVLPAFCIGVERVHGFGDYGSPSGPLPCAGALGRAILHGVMEAGFDPATSLNMSVDHGLTQPYEALDRARETPIVPIMVNAAGAPRPSFRRCHAFGRAVGEAIRASDEAGRVVVVASGGMSHWLPAVSADDAAISPETRDYVINGRSCVREYNAARERSSAERKRKGVQGRVNDEWDRWFLSCLATGDLEPIFALTSEQIEEQAGNGAHELRSWLAALGAWNGPVGVAGYEPVPLWLTGMGCIAGFAQ